MLRWLYGRCTGKRALLTLALALATVGQQALAADPPARTWKDTTGEFEIQATFVSEKNGTVTLKQTDGELLEIELSQLSTADQKFVQTQKSNPFKKKPAASPFKPKPTAGDDSAPASPAAEEMATESPGSAAAVSIDWTGAQLSQPADQPRWGEIQISPPPSKSKRNVALPKKRDFFEKLTGLAIGPQTSFVGYKLESRGPGEKTCSTRLVACDLTAGKVLSTALLDGDYALLDVSPSAGTVLVKKDVWGFGNQDQLETWKVTGKTISRQGVFTCFEDESGPGRDIRWAAFLSDDQIAVLSGQGRFGVFNPESGMGVFTATLGHQCAAALSPDRKYVAIATGKEVQILDAATGDGLATLGTGEQSLPGLAFSPDGKRLCLQASERVICWELSDGSVYRDIVLSGLPIQPNIPPVCTSPTHVLVGGNCLIDLEKFVRLWQYNGAESVAAAGDQVIFCLSGHQNAYALLAARLPHDAAAKALEVASKDPNFFVVSPGTSVQLDVSAVPDAAQQQKVREALTARLNEAGLKVAASAPVVVRATVENKGSEQTTFRSFGFGFGETSVNVTKWLSSVRMLLNGQPIWETQVMASPHFVNRSGDETIEQAVKKANVPNYGFFSSVGIPGYVMKPRPNNQATLGTSALMANGIR